MSELDLRREIVAEVFDAFIDPSETPGTYTAPGGSETPCRLLLNRGIRQFGDFGHAPGENITVRIVREDIENPVRDGLVTTTSIALGTETFKLVEKLADDGALTTWSVTTRV